MDASKRPVPLPRLFQHMCHFKMIIKQDSPKSWYFPAADSPSLRTAVGILFPILPTQNDPKADLSKDQPISKTGSVVNIQLSLPHFNYIKIFVFPYSYPRSEKLLVESSTPNIFTPNNQHFKMWPKFWSN